MHMMSRAKRLLPSRLLEHACASKREREFSLKFCEISSNQEVLAEFVVDLVTSGLATAHTARQAPTGNVRPNALVSDARRHAGSRLVHISRNFDQFGKFLQVMSEVEKRQLGNILRKKWLHLHCTIVWSPLDDKICRKRRV